MISNDFIVTVNGVAFNCITDLNVAYEKLWSENAGRTYKDGEFMGTLIGIFPTLGIEFAPRTSQELKNLIVECNKSTQTLQWFNPQYMNKVTSVFYSNTLKVSLRKALAGDYDRVPINFISTKRQGV